MYHVEINRASLCRLPIYARWPWSPTKSIAARNNQYGKIPGVLGRSEFGLEIVVEIAYLVYVVGLSFDKVCLLLNFFQNLQLRKSQADALLHQLSRHWASEFDGSARCWPTRWWCMPTRRVGASEQRVGVSLGEGAGAVVRRAQGCRHAASRFSIRRRLPAS